MARGALSSAGVAAALLVAGCTVDTAPDFEVLLTPSDAGVTGPPVVIAPPAPAEAPRLTPCPPGWREVAGPMPGDAVTCEPWPDGGYVRCADDEAHFPGTAGCQRLGPTCPAGDFATDLPQGPAILYVKAGATGGTGTLAAPFGRIADAVLASQPGTIIALSKGAFTDVVALPAGRVLWGACVQGTVLGRSTQANNGQLTSTGAGAVARNLRVTGPHFGVVLDGAGRTLELHDVVFSSTEVAGLLVFNGARLTGSRVVVRGTRPRGTMYGQAMEAGAGASIDLSQVLIEDNTYRSVAAQGVGTSLHLTDVAVRATKQLGGIEGRGVSAHDGARLELERAVIEQNFESAGYAEVGSTLVLRDAVVRDTAQTTVQPDNGIGVSITTANVVLERVSLERNRGHGVWVVTTSSADLTDVVVRDTLEKAGSRKDGSGVLVSLGSNARLRRVALERNHKSGLEVLQSQVDAFDVTARGNLAQVSDGFEGQGLAAIAASRLTAERVRLERNSCANAVGQDPGTTVALKDVVSNDAQPCPNGFDGIGLVAQLGAWVTAERAVLERNAADGVFVAAAGSRFEGTDLVSRDETGEREIGQLGNGLHAQVDVTVKLTRARFERNREVSIFLVARARLEGTEVEVLDGLESACPPARCLARGGIGIAAIEDSSLVLDGFTLARHASVGMYLGMGGVADLSNGVVLDNPIGVAVRTDGFDLSRLDRGVVFFGNGRKLDSAEVPLPKSMQ